MYNRDGGFMDYISSLVNTKFQIAKKDSWNPADIWLIRSSKLSAYKKQLDESVVVQECNAILIKAFTKKDIVGVSLKKNNGQKLNYDLVNLKTSSTDDKVEFKKFKLNITYNGPSKTFMSVTSKLEVEYQNKSYFMGIKSNQGGIGNITYEFVGSGSAAFLARYQRICLN